MAFSLGRDLEILGLGFQVVVRVFRTAKKPPARWLQLQILIFGYGLSAVQLSRYVRDERS
jgi:hypothetical protein